MKIIKRVVDWKENLKKLKRHSHCIGVVPTMGAFHEGHLSLIRKSLNENDVTVVTLFVNPTQFNDPTDLEKYPNKLTEDIGKLKELSVDYLFLPNYRELYADDFCYQVSEKKISKILCGQSRSGHFEGVLTVVLKLLLIIEAHNAYFGEKDYQQYLLIEGMVKSFFIKTKIIPCPTIREKDGLAMSSRNLLLDDQSRKMAPNFFKLLNSSLSLDDVKKRLMKLGFEVDYLEEVMGRRFGAVKLNKVRLIDNVKQ